MTDAMKEMLKEGLRLVIFAAIGAAVTFIINVVIPSLPESQTVIILTFALKMVDKYIHKSPTDVNGILPF